jgi:hypothetical protein
MALVVLVKELYNYGFVSGQPWFSKFVDVLRNIYNQLDLFI